MKILAVKLRRLGDTILWTAALRALREHFPQAEIDLGIPPHYAPLFTHDPRYQAKIPMARGIKNQIRQIQELHKKKYDIALNFHASERSAALVLFSGANLKLIHHHSRKPRNFFSDRPIRHLGKVMAANERDLNVVRTLGWDGNAPDTKIVVGETDREAARGRLNKLGWNEREPLVVIHASASRPAKEWGFSKYSDLAKRLSSHARVAVVFDNPATFANERYLRHELQKSAWLVPTPKLEEVMGVLSHAKIFVGSDSGIKHMACGIGVPTITLFGPESLGEWHGYDPVKHRALQNKVACRSEDRSDPKFSWCGFYRCPLASHACMNLFAVEDVLTEVLRVI